MIPESEHWVPKVHPLTRQVEPEDPLELVTMPAQGAPDVMLDCILQEFAWMGCDADSLLGLFQSPDYPVLNQLRQLFGDQEIRRRVEVLLAGSVLFRVREQIAEEPDETDEPELIELSIRTKRERN